MDGLKIYWRVMQYLSQNMFYISKNTDKKNWNWCETINLNKLHPLLPNAIFCGFLQHRRIRFTLPVRVLNKQERRSEVRGGAGRACLLARRSLASHPLASCQPRCPSPSLNPLRQTGCQRREAANMPHRTNTPTANFCSVFIYPFAVCLCLEYKGQVNRWTRAS